MHTHIKTDAHHTITHDAHTSTYIHAHTHTAYIHTYLDIHTRSAFTHARVCRLRHLGEAAESRIHICTPARGSFDEWITQAKASFDLSPWGTSTRGACMLACECRVWGLNTFRV